MGFNCVKNKMYNFYKNFIYIKQENKKQMIIKRLKLYFAYSFKILNFFEPIGLKLNDF